MLVVAEELDVTLRWLEYPSTVTEVLYFIQFLWRANTYIIKLEGLRNEEETQ